MSKSLMLTWIEQSLTPHVATAMEGIIPLLFLDSFSVQLMGSVNRTINALGVEVIMIPPGCTGVMQLKGLVRDQYEEWMVKDSNDLSTPPPGRVDVTRLIVAAEREMKLSTKVNAWMRHDLEYFPRASPVVDVPPVVQVPTVEDVTNLISDMEAGSDDDDAGALVSV